MDTKNYILKLGIDQSRKRQSTTEAFKKSSAYCGLKIRAQDLSSVGAILK
jgi:hypothetical protein